MDYRSVKISEEKVPSHHFIICLGTSMQAVIEHLITYLPS